MATCPECGSKVRKDNLKKHINKVHSKAEEAKESRVEAKPSKRTSKRRSTVSPWPAIVLSVIMALSASGVYLYMTMSSGGSGTPPPARNPVAVIETNYGTFKIELYTSRAPVTAGNFISLADEGFYNGLTIHRVVPDFVIQGGDPNGDGTGGSGTTVPWENTGLLNKKYTVAMARSGDPNSPQGANTATSQFFVNLKDNPSLDGYTYPFVVFGAVVEGHDVVDAIGQVPTDANSKPLTPVVMTSVVIVR